MRAAGHKLLPSQSARAPPERARAALCAAPGDEPVRSGGPSPSKALKSRAPAGWPSRSPFPWFRAKIAPPFPSAMSATGPEQSSGVSTASRWIEPDCAEDASFCQIRASRKISVFHVKEATELTEVAIVVVGVAESEHNADYVEDGGSASSLPRRKIKRLRRRFSSIDKVKTTRGPGEKKEIPSRIPAGSSRKNPVANQLITSLSFIKRTNIHKNTTAFQTKHQNLSISLGSRFCGFHQKVCSCGFHQKVCRKHFLLKFQHSSLTLCWCTYVYFT